MSLQNKILESAPAQPDARRIGRQIRHLDRAIANEIANGREGDRLVFLYASYQALMWARSPDSFAPPVQMLDSY